MNKFSAIFTVLLLLIFSLANSFSYAAVMNTNASLIDPSDGSTITYDTIINVKVDLSFDNNTKQGDTTRIELPPYMNYAGISSFNVTNSNGDVIGNVTVSNGVALFTAGDYFNTHLDVMGSFNLLNKANGTWGAEQIREVYVNIDGEKNTTGASLKLTVPTGLNYSESITPIQNYVSGVQDIFHMYSTPTFTTSGTTTIEFISGSYPDAYYNCENIMTKGLTLRYGTQKNNYKMVNTVNNKDQYGINVTCTGGKVTLTMNVEQGYGFTTGLPVLLSEEVKSTQSRSIFPFTTNSVHPDGTTWTQTKNVNYNWLNTDGSGVVTTEAPTTEAPTTEAPTTEAPTTEAPTTEAPTTEAPTTEAPTTEAPTTEAPTTEAPTTEVPTTEAPTTEVPTTEAPTTEVPTTEAPTTEAPTTEVPTTEAPTTEAPTTEAPTTEVPTTEAPTTEAPTTEAPTTEAPAPEPCTNEAGLQSFTQSSSSVVMQDTNNLSIGDHVWWDENWNNMFDVNEKPVVGLEVSLRDYSGNTIGRTVTDAQGNYKFEGLESGTYILNFHNPLTWSPVIANIEADLHDGIDSDGPTDIIVNLKDNNLNVDQGYYYTGLTAAECLPTTEVPTTEAPTTEVPTTEVPTTETPTTEAPTTEVPTTEAPTTEAPTTEAPTTETPTTEAPITEAPTTEAPITEAPTTEAPATPTTETPATPTTETPATPTTEAPATPTTETPTTPTTETPTTPTTEQPSTETPTTEAPTTEVPTTEVPTTEVPTTEAPTTGTPTTEVPVVVISSPEQPVPMKPTIPNKQSKPNAPVNNIKATPSEMSLPDTGETALNTGLISLIFAAVGGLIVISARRRKEMK